MDADGKPYESDGGFACAPTCDGTRCGDDGCGGLCGCASAQVCDETQACRFEGEQMVPLRDSVRLRTHVILPSRAAGPVPALLLRTPYGWLKDSVLPAFRPFTEQGIAFVYQMVRGTGDSEGELSPITQEFADGQDTVRWITSQPWSNGKVGTLGGSYEGITALAAAVDTPAVKVVIPDGHLIRGYESFPMTHNGVVSWNLLWWIHLVKTKTDYFTDAEKLAVATNHRPLVDLDKALFGAEVAAWREAVQHIDKRTDYWDAWDVVGKFGRICTPILHLEASDEWEDDPLDGFLEAHASTCPEEIRKAQRYVLGEHHHTGAVYDPFGSGPASKLIIQYIENQDVEPEDADFKVTE